MYSTIGPTISANTGIRVVDAGSKYKNQKYILLIKCITIGYGLDRPPPLSLSNKKVLNSCIVLSAVPQLSMHSVREVMSVVDLAYGVDLFRTFFEKFRTVDENLSKEIK